MIPDQKIEEIRDTADIVEVVSDYVKLKKSGKNFLGLCPFHSEKTPSFNVSPDLGIYKCFGCDASGDVFSFVEEMEGVGFTEAARSLADRYGIELPEGKSEEDERESTLREGIYHALRFAGMYYHKMLRETDEGVNARRYLKERDFTWKTIRHFGLGYAPENGSLLYEAAVDTGISEEYLQEAGLIRPSKHGQGYYDVFRGRLMFPIFNPSGKVIAFAGRVLSGNQQAKYINSAQTPVYNKSEVVYATNFAKQEIRRQNEAVLVEGYTDVMALHQAGVKQAVATSGTSLTEGQMRTIHRYGETIVMLYDSDQAGLNAMKRGIRMALEEGMAVRMLDLPEGEDPDSFIKQFGRESFLAYKEEHELDFIDFMIEQAEFEGRWDDPTGKQQVINDLLDAIASISDQVRRETYVQYLNQKIHIGDRVLQEELQKRLQERKKSKKKEQQRQKRAEVRQQQNEEAASNEEQPLPQQPSDNKSTNDQSGASATKKPSYEKELLRLMLVYPGFLIEYIGGLCNENQFENQQLKEFYQDIIQRYQEGKEISIEHYAQREKPYPELIGEIALEPYSVSDRHEKEGNNLLKKDRDPFATAKGSLKALQIHHLNRVQEQLNREYSNADPEHKRELLDQINEIARERNRMQNTTDDNLYPDPPPDTDTPTMPHEFEMFVRDWEQRTGYFRSNE